MKNIQRERLLGYGALAGLIWVASHLALSFLNNHNGLFESNGHYNGAVYGLMAVYAASLLAFDTLLWFVKSREANRLIGRYWAVSCVLMVLWLLFRQPLMASESGGSLLAIFLIWMATPFSPVLPASYLSLFHGLRMDWSGVMAWHSVIVFLLCTAHFLYFCWLSHRTRGGKGTRARPTEL
jgi:hypothetical protein